MTPLDTAFGASLLLQVGWLLLLPEYLFVSCLIAVANVTIWAFCMSRSNEQQTLEARRCCLARRKTPPSPKMQSERKSTTSHTVNVVLATSGKLGSGKDTASDEFRACLERMCRERKIEFEWESVAFAKRLKDTVAALSGQPLQNTNTIQGKNHYLPVFHSTLGEMLQDVGMVMRWLYGPDIWVKLALDQPTPTPIQPDDDGDASPPPPPPPPPTLRIRNITDCRFPNEADAILALPNSLIVRMVGDPMGVRRKTTRDIHHISETALDSYALFDHIIENDIPDMARLRHRIEFIAQQLIEQHAPKINKKGVS